MRFLLNISRMTKDLMPNMKFPFNKKVNTDGTYRDFYGYTTVSMLKEDLSSIENFIRDSDILSKYFSPLPSSSYHMTVFNVWSQYQKQLCVFKKFLDEQGKADEERRKKREEVKQKYEDIADGYYDGPDAYYLKYPERKRKTDVCDNDVPIIMEGVRPVPCKDFWLQVMTNVDAECKGLYIKEFNAKVFNKRNSCEKTGTLGVGIQLDKETSDILTDLRNKISKHVGHGDEWLVPHMTLAYRYRDIPTCEIESVNNEIEKMNKHIMEISKNGITFYKPFASWFADMLEFLSAKDIFF